jgi:8-oxo-dGTP diphosphatase
MPPTIHVVAAILRDDRGRVLVAQRPPGKSLAGAWEFPGGKLRDGEARHLGLARELDEELGIRVDAARPLIRHRHCYTELEVDLDAWLVTRWHGTPHGREGQAIDWRPVEELSDIGLLPADVAIVRAIRLPELFAVTSPSAPDGEEAFLDALEAAAERLAASSFTRPEDDRRSGRRSGFRREDAPWSRLKPLLQPLLQPPPGTPVRATPPHPRPLLLLRRPDLDPPALMELAAGAACRVEGTGVSLVLHGDPACLAPMLMNPPAALRARIGEAVAGLHVTARSLAALGDRPVPSQLWFGASCHDARDLETALALGADYAFLGPVKPTASHPGAPGIGWEAFSAMIDRLPLPVYAIGGLAPADLDTAWAAGAQGVAAIRALWPA